MENDYSNIILPWSEWHIVKFLGHGAYGKVFEIQRQSSGIQEKAALKMISRPGSQEEIDTDYENGYDERSIITKYQDILQDYINEYKLQMELKGQSNIVSCDDFATVPHENGIGWDIFIRMELLSPLKNKLKNQMLSPQEVTKLGKDICRALILCESKNIIHRDIKPENIMVSGFGDYKLGDFGTAKITDHSTKGTQTGTDGYWAPEVRHMQKYGKEADIYSLGMVLYWLLNNKRMPFINADVAPTWDSVNQAIQRRYDGEPLPAPRDGSPELKNIVLKACEYDPKKRFHSASEMYNALDSIGQEIAGSYGNTASNSYNGTARNNWDNSGNSSSGTVGNNWDNHGNSSNGTVGNNWHNSGNSSNGTAGNSWNNSGNSSSSTVDNNWNNSGNSFNGTVSNNWEDSGNPATGTVGNSWNDTYGTVGKSFGGNGANSHARGGNAADQMPTMATVGKTEAVRQQEQPHSRQTVRQAAAPEALEADAVPTDLPLTAEQKIAKYSPYWPALILSALVFVWSINLYQSIHHFITSFAQIAPLLCPVVCILYVIFAVRKDMKKRLWNLALLITLILNIYVTYQFASRDDFSVYLRNYRIHVVVSGLFIPGIIAIFLAYEIIKNDKKNPGKLSAYWPSIVMVAIAFRNCMGGDFITITQTMFHDIISYHRIGTFSIYAPALIIYASVIYLILCIVIGNDKKYTTVIMILCCVLMLMNALFYKMTSRGVFSEAEIFTQLALTVLMLIHIIKCNRPKAKKAEK